jgi:tight adherence protein B
MPQTSLFILAVFATVFVLFYSLAAPTLGGERAIRKRVSKRLQNIRLNNTQEGTNISLARQNFIQELTPTEQKLEAIPIIRKLSLLIEQGGNQKVAYRVAIFFLLIGSIVSIIVWIFVHSILLALLAGIVVVTVFIMALMKKRTARIDKFEEQLPDALDTITRALRAGYPFTETLHVVGEEMQDPIAGEFEEAFVEISYGYDAKVALHNLLARMPSVSLMAFVTAVLIQRDTGGNLAEILSTISSLIRARFKLQRKVQTLSAEGRLSGWVLALLPFALAIMVTIVNPDYLPMMFDHPMGVKLAFGGLIFMLIGLLWMRKIIRIDI